MRGQILTFKISLYHLRSFEIMSDHLRSFKIISDHLRSFKHLKTIELSMDMTSLKGLVAAILRVLFNGGHAKSCACICLFGNIEVFVRMTEASMDSILAPCQPQYKSILDHSFPAMYSLNIPKSNVQIRCIEVVPLYIAIEWRVHSLSPPPDIAP